MGMNWLHGPREFENTALSGSSLRAMLLDVEVLRDIARETVEAATETWRRLYGHPPVVSVAYRVDNRSIPESEVAALSVWDKDRLRFEVLVRDGEDPTRHLEVYIDAPNAFVSVIGPHEGDLAQLKQSVRFAVVRRLEAEGKLIVSWRVLWARIPWALPLAVLFLGIWFWASENIPLPGVLLFAVGWAATIRWAWKRSAARFAAAATRAFRYRAVAKAETDRTRAATAANIRVALITAPIAVAVTLVGAMATAYFSGSLRSDADTYCRAVAEAVSAGETVNAAELGFCLEDR
ncbi:hypothetical protein [Microbacterium arborescens]|uniref:hypothetical protein n=1 Tax=Microbacterium arborescens TaxID=33883 RepID=UPI000DF741BF|nr:hypothetical protein [Microbacterium arborescens]